ncbi:hypothetical protein SipoB123_13125 [Streptomyces ipomoeae]|nr:hypothetical protein SipoB123_13125 [Streptomyces ipomoeae]
MSSPDRFSSYDHSSRPSTAIPPDARRGARLLDVPHGQRPVHGRRELPHHRSAAGSQQIRHAVGRAGKQSRRQAEPPQSGRHDPQTADRRPQTADRRPQTAENPIPPRPTRNRPDRRSHSRSYPYIRRIANSTICSTAFASKTIRCSPSMSRTKP